MIDKQEEKIQINSDDSCFERARKMLKAAGLIDNGMVALRMAEVVDAYQKLDLKTFYDGYVFKNNRNYAPREQVTLIASAEDIKRWKKFYREQNNEMP